MGKDKSSLRNMSSNCPHIGNQLASITDIKNLEEVKSCATCHYIGINLWICLHRNCLRVGCSEQAEDHSAQHFQFNNAHCVHLNLTSYRAWCYLCEREVFPALKDPLELIEPFIEATTSHYNIQTDNDGTSPTVGLVGMHNIANTCYMNSALQALSNAQPMTHYFLHCGDLVEHSANLSASRTKAGLAKSYHNLIEDIWSKGDNEQACIAPRGVLYNIRSVHPMFRGFHQHDTQEFLRCFMDQLHEELKEQSSFQAKTENGVKDESIEKLSSRSPSPPCSDSETEYETCDSSVSGDDSSSIIDRFGNSDPGCGRLLQKSSTPDHKADNVANRSIISEVFDGKLLSSVQCLTCDRISTREETFQDLSLPIPNRDFLTVLHNTNSFSVQSLNFIDSTMSRNSENWISWMWSMLKSWLWGPSITLYDCMASFFSADELKGDNMYSCEKCKKLRTGVKYSRILDLPEMLCIHLKRFRHDLSYSSKISAYVQFPLEGFEMKPYLHKDCKSKYSTYNLSSVICHHGTVGGGHYTCFARNALNNRWYEYDDHRVTEVDPDIVQNCQAYVLFYRKHNQNMDIIRMEARELSIRHPVRSSDIRFYVAREWLSRLYTFAEPGPINNWDILCPHGGLLQSKAALLSKIAVPISQQLWDFLYGKFGGGPSINMLFECEVCKRLAESLSRRQYYELAVFTKYNGMDSELDSSPIFAISMTWLRKWQQFARGNTHKEPGPITNADIAVSADKSSPLTPIQNVRSGSDYAQLNAPLWRFLHGIYGGGPEIILRGSLTDEIEIVDEDEYHENLSQDNPGISDTESNIGRKNASDNGVQDATDEASEDPIEDPLCSNTQSDDHRVVVDHKRETTQNRHSSSSSRKFKAGVVRGNFRRRTKKSRNTLKSLDVFGSKGSSTHKKLDSMSGNSNAPTHKERTLTKYSAARDKHSRRSFQIEEQNSNSNENIKKHCDSNEPLEKFDMSKMPKTKGQSKGKNAVRLTKFAQLSEFSGSAESDM